MTPMGGTRLSWASSKRHQLACYEGKDHIFRDVYGRLNWNKVGPTITTKFLRISNGRYGHPEEDRGLSLREGATLQTFPKEYVFYAHNLDGKARQIGNAVPPKLAEKIALQILKG
jgi:DNA (cytosine-5)-methyltransferase 1